jgi:fatty acid desaturase
MLVAVMILPLLAFCQDGTGSAFDPSVYFVSVGSLAAAVIAVTEFIKSKITLGGWKSKAVSWLVSIILSASGWALKLGIFSGIEWYWMLLYAFSCGLIANGIFDTTIIYRYS